MLLWAAAAYGEPLELEEHRFSRHIAAKYDRLVLQFKGTAGPLGVKENSASRLQRNLVVSNAKLAGAIPESAINSSYMDKSRYLGKIAINPFFPPSGFSVSVDLKVPQTRVAAFWLQNPPRLVIDAFPADSARVAGLKNLPKDTAKPQRTAASARKNKEAGWAMRDPASEKELFARQLLEKYTCFPSASRVGMGVNFHMRDTDRRQEQIPVNLGGGPTAADIGSPLDNIVCYPRDAEVIPRFTFSDDNLFRQMSIPTVEPKQAEKPDRLPSFLRIPTGEDGQFTETDSEPSARTPSAQSPKTPLP